MRETDLDHTVRVPIDAAEASKLLEHIEKWKGKVSKQWKARANAHQQVMEKGDPYGYAEVFKGLSKLDQEGTLRALDRAHLKQSTQLLSVNLPATVKPRTGSQPEPQADMAREHPHRRCQTNSNPSPQEQ